MGKIAIVGKPNVGKSTLFNALTKKNRSLVLDIPGTTRDRVFEYGAVLDKEALFIDTGGFDIEGEFSDKINEQVKLAIDSSDAVIVVFDATTPLSVLDDEIFKYVIKSSKPYVLTINKSDIKNREFIYEYYRFGEALEISASHRMNISTIQEKLYDYIKTEEKDEFDAKVAIVGRSNVGKSSLLNAIMNESRSVVSSKVGTTTDSIDTPYEFEGHRYLLVDTAGIRRKGKTKKSLDKLASIFSIFSIDRADIAILVLDAKEGLTSLDKQIADIVAKKHKGIIIALNKWDLIEDKERFDKYVKYLKHELPFLQFAEIIPTSATEIKNTTRLLRNIAKVKSVCSQRISTSQLNEDLNRIIKANAPFSKRGRELKLKYMTQVEANPPHFVIFTNRSEDIEENYKRYIRNSMYRIYGFKGCSIKITYRNSKNEEFE
jgi:GTP-binding protein